MTTLLSLPNELLALIVQFVRPNAEDANREGISPLWFLWEENNKIKARYLSQCNHQILLTAFTCRRLCRVALPILYQHVGLGYSELHLGEFANSVHIHRTAEISTLHQNTESISGLRVVSQDLGMLFTLPKLRDVTVNWHHLRHSHSPHTYQ